MSAFSVDKASKNYIRLSTADYKYPPSIINGIMRMMMNFVDVYCFDDFIDPDDYEFFRNVLKVPRLFEGRQHYTTLINNTRYPDPSASQRLSSLVINNTDDTVKLLEETETRKVYFAICGNDEDPIKQISKPLLNQGGLPLFIHSRDLTPFVFLRQEENWVYDKTESDTVKNSMDVIFSYNSKVMMLEHGKKFNVIVKPMLCRGIDNPRGTPCTSKYRWVMNPRIPDIYIKGKRQELIDDKYVLRRKIEGEYSAKDLFLLDPMTLKDDKMDFHNKFGIPYGLDLIFFYNGKMNPSLCMTKSIRLFIDKLELFRKEFNSPSAVIHHEKSDDNHEYLIIPRNVDMDLSSYKDGEYHPFIDHSLLNAISTRALQIVDSVIGDDIPLWENVLIYSKVPHPLIPQAELVFQLPESELLKKIRDTYKYNTGQTVASSLMNQTIDELITMLSLMLNSVDDDMDEGDVDDEPEE